MTLVHEALRETRKHLHLQSLVVLLLDGHFCWFQHVLTPQTWIVRVLDICFISPASFTIHQFVLFQHVRIHILVEIHPCFNYPAIYINITNITIIFNSLFFFKKWQVVIPRLCWKDLSWGSFLPDIKAQMLPQATGQPVGVLALTFAAASQLGECAIPLCCWVRHAVLDLCWLFGVYIHIAYNNVLGQQ